MSPVYFFIADASPLFLFGDAGFTMHSFSDVPDSISQGVRDDTSCNRACSQVFLASCPDVRADQGSTAASHCVRLITVEFRGFAAGSPPRGRPSKPPAFRNPPPGGFETLRLPGRVPGRDELAELRPPGGAPEGWRTWRGGNGLWAALSPGPRRQDATGGGCGPPSRLWAY